MPDYLQASYEIWEAMAPGWERQREYLRAATRPLDEWILARLEPAPGQTILELAGGPGETGFQIAPLLGEAGRLISTDFSPSMVEIARHRAAVLGLTNVECRVMDAERMDLPDASVDGVVCRWGYMLMADPAAAFAETRRVLRRGGRLCFVVFGPPDQSPVLALPLRVLIDLGHASSPAPGAPGLFSMARRETIQDFLVSAGFGPPRIEEMTIHWSFDDLVDYWSLVTELAGALAMVINRLDESERERVRAELEERVEPFRVDGGYRFPSLCLNVLAS